jgi:hypothetical protein
MSFRLRYLTSIFAVTDALVLTRVSDYPAPIDEYEPEAKLVDIYLEELGTKPDEATLAAKIAEIFSDMFSMTFYAEQFEVEAKAIIYALY